MLVKLQNKSKGQSAFTFYMPTFSFIRNIGYIFRNLYTCILDNTP
ncbi:hypothetical protein BACCELL_04730 [Bacteroides cellulosilyticus DSM 14838]|uniref:Uncharacterized protein n=1 Tax=Bacteroides cellulosilyticus DSM 14838 TaxID=537012 RepID=E2NK89_9BACE|nr:hypothetical protein BACCELL_04730 [Bacteroides cellulosilyticus DSM 14838]